MKPKKLALFTVFMRLLPDLGIRYLLKIQLLLILSVLLPYSGTDGDYYDQSKSWYYLFVQYVNPLVSNQENARKFQSYPLSYVLNGTMGVSTGGKTLYFATHNGYYTSNTTASATQYDWMVVTRYGFKTAEVTGKASQTALRCVHRFSILS